MPVPDGRPAPLALTPEQIRGRRARNVAIGICVALFALLFYVVTLVKLGSAVGGRAR